MVHASGGDALPRETELRLSRFANLVATAIVNAQTREELRRLAEEQAALRRVATLVARESPSHEVFETVATELGNVLRVEDVALMRYEDDATATVVARWASATSRCPSARACASTARTSPRLCTAPPSPRASTTTAARREPSALACTTSDSRRRRHADHRKGACGA